MVRRAPTCTRFTPRASWGREATGLCTWPHTGGSRTATRTSDRDGNVDRLAASDRLILHC